MRVVAAESFVWDDRMVPVGEAVDIDDPHTIRRLFAAGKLEPSLDLDRAMAPALQLQQVHSDRAIGIRRQ